MIDKQFQSGNYNDFSKFFNEYIPEKLKTFREVILESVDNILVSMLGVNSAIQRANIDANLVCDQHKLQALEFDVTYNVEDFQVPDAPKQAIDQDTKAIQDALSFEDFNIKSLNIDTQKGTLHIIFTLNLER